MIFKGQRQDLLTSWVFFDIVLWQQKDVIQKGRTLINRITQVCTKIWNWPKKIRFTNLTSFESGADLYLFPHQSTCPPCLNRANRTALLKIHVTWWHLAPPLKWWEKKHDTKKNKNCFSHLCRHSSCPYVRPC